MKGNILILSTKEKNFVLAGYLENYGYNVESGLLSELLKLYTSTTENVDVVNLISKTDVVIFEYKGNLENLKIISRLININSPDSGLILLLDNESELPDMNEMRSLGITGYCTLEDNFEKIIFFINSRLEILKKIEELKKTNLQVVKSLRKVVESKDVYTVGHSDRVSKYALLIAKEFNLTDKEMLDLKYGALFHDIGKVGIADSIIQKETKLTDEEYAEMKRHPEIGFYIVSGLDYLEAASEIIVSHHEWYNGNGYPEGLVGENINFLARITSVADAFDAITTTRSYRKANTFEYALSEIKRCSGTQFDPKVVKAFEKVFATNMEELKEIHKI